MRIILTLLAVILPLALQAGQLTVTPVSDGVYALVGPYDQRNAENLGNNSTHGLVVTGAGAVLIDAGGSYRGAAALHAAIKDLTDQPVTHVINTGGQDHRWIGNGYWRDQGATIIASEAAVTDQAARASMQGTMLSTLLGDAFDGTVPVHADITFADSYTLEIGNRVLDLTHAPAHTPGDAFVWLADDRVVFTGDMVFAGRLLGVLEGFPAKDWIDSFEKMAALEPAVVVPGHGPVTDLATATRDTYDYLVNLRSQIGAHIEAGGDIIGAPGVDQSAFADLVNFDMLAGRNAQEVFSQMEWE